MRADDGQYSRRRVGVSFPGYELANGKLPADGHGGEVGEADAGETSADACSTGTDC